jgi:virginiamycin B lyase
LWAKNQAPDGIIVGPDGSPWITDGGLNEIFRVDPDTGSE